MGTTRGAAARIAVFMTMLLTACDGAGSARGPAERLPPGADVKFDRLTVSGVSVDYPYGWEPCRVRSIDLGVVVDVREPDAPPEFAAPLTFQVADGAGAYERMLRRDRLFMAVDPPIEEAIDVPGATAATLWRFDGHPMGPESVGMSVYAHAGADAAVRVSMLAAPEWAGDFERVFFDVVESLDLQADDVAETELPVCEERPLPTPRPTPATDDVPAELVGMYAMKLTREQIAGSALDDSTPLHWALRLQGGRLELLGATRTGTRNLVLPILKAAPSTLVVETSGCGTPGEPTPVSITLAIDGRRLVVDDVEPACDGQLKDLLTLNAWTKQA